MASPTDDSRHCPCPYCDYVDFFMADIMWVHRHIASCSKEYIDQEIKKMKPSLIVHNHSGSVTIEHKM